MVYNKQKDITIIHQKTDLLKTYPESECKSERNDLYWKGILQPTPLSDKYEVLIKYTIRKPPYIQVFVVNQNFKNLDNPSFPHKYKVYPEKNTVKICLDRYKVFTKKKYISTTIIPWTLEWLYFYEIWNITGVWCGGGEHPINTNNKHEY